MLLQSCTKPSMYNGGLIQAYDKSIADVLELQQSHWSYHSLALIHHYGEIKARPVSNTLLYKYGHFFLPNSLMRICVIRAQNVKNIEAMVICYKISVDHSEVVGPSIACWRCSNYIFILNSTPDFDGLGKDTCKTRCETFKFWDSVHLIVEVWQYQIILSHQ